MLGRYGRVIAALGGLIVALGCAGYGVGEPAAKHPNPAATQEQTKPQPPSPATSKASEPPAGNCNGAKTGEDDASCYARRSVEATERQADDADTSISLGAIEAGGLVLSLIFTGWAALSAAKATGVARMAAEDAAKSAAASQQQVDYMRRASRAGLAFSYTVRPDLNGGRLNGVVVHARLANTGATAARQFASFMTPEYGVAPLPDPVVFHVPRRALGSQSLAASDSVLSGGVAISVDDLIAAYEGKQWLAILTCGVFQDIFDDKAVEIEESCVRLMILKDPRDDDWDKVQGQQNGPIMTPRIENYRVIEAAAS